ncbi:hypothetical protein ACQ4PT_012554 [Festuca glaucescens]
MHDDMDDGADPEAEVVSLSPRTLLDSSRYACEICGQMFRREQNLVFHRRGHDMPRKRRDAAAAPRKKRRDEAAASRKKRVFVCLEPSCLRHHPSHALADHIGIKKHFLRKHGGHRQWACARCSKAYAVLNDYKAHVKTCGTRIFTRVDSFVEHRDTCSAAVGVSSPSVRGVAAAAASKPTARSPCRSSPSSDSVMAGVAVRNPAAPAFHRFLNQGPTPPTGIRGGGPHNLELQLMPPSCYAAATHSPQVPISLVDDDVGTELRRSIGFCSGDNRGGEFRPSLFTGHVVEERAVTGRYGYGELRDDRLILGLMRQRQHAMMNNV